MTFRKINLSLRVYDPAPSSEGACVFTLVSKVKTVYVQQRGSH